MVENFITKCAWDNLKEAHGFVATFWATKCLKGSINKNSEGFNSAGVALMLVSIFTGWSNKVSETLIQKGAILQTPGV